MRTLLRLLALTTAAAVAACAPPPAEKPAEPAAAAAAAPKAHASLLQLMRAIDFPHSNVIFDTQTKDPAAKPAEKKGDDESASAKFSSMYGGWEAVENSSLALAESAHLILIPGRVCSNGKPVPVENEDFKKFTQGLVDAGMAAYKAAQSKNLEAMNEVSGTVADACAQCHEVYRDNGPAGSPERCVAGKPAAE